MTVNERPSRFNWRSVFLRRGPNPFLQLPQVERDRVILRTFLFVIIGPVLLWALIWMTNWLWG